MIFNTYWFCLFSAIFFPLYWFSRLSWLRLCLLLSFCLIFHAHFAGAAGIIPIIVLSLTTYFAGLSRKLWILRLGMFLPIIALIFYKYTHFLALSCLSVISPHLGLHVDQILITALPLTPPLAISFFVFEFVHYLYDVSCGEASIKNPAYFCAFTFFFPSLVAGPIKRYKPFIASLTDGLRQVSLDDLKCGVVRIALGLFKKVVIADNLTPGIDFWHARLTELNRGERWLFVLALGVRILMDFSGYSDIAIGLARLMGISLPENFYWPYAANSLQAFWQRWHISLSSWIRDYVYIPLGGNRHGLTRKVFNGLFAFALCGLWHGPAWNFITWGLLHGVGLALNSSYRSWGLLGRFLGQLFDRIPILGWVLTLLFVFIGWIYFFYPIDEASRIVSLLVVAHS
jgi:alginate O-acetyltransferase complex protein AlgI